MNKKAAILFLLSVLMYACSKKSDDVEPVPGNGSSKITLQSDVVGKWMIETPNARKAEKGAFIEFLSDSTYIIYNLTPSAVSGKYKATSNTEITLDKFGSITEAKITKGKISFKIAYSGVTVLVSGTKSNAVDVSDKTKQLSHIWSLNNEGDGMIVFVSEDDYYGKQIEKLTIRFSPSGTYLVQMYNKGEVFRSDMINWKWHSSKSDRIVYWKEGQTANDEVNNIIITEITNKVLKTTENTKQTDGELLTFNLTFSRLD
jgi:hypothetical protein